MLFLSLAADDLALSLEPLWDCTRFTLATRVTPQVL